MNGKAISLVVFLVGLIVGGGGSASIAHFRYESLREKFELRRDNVDEQFRSMERERARVVGQINERLARIETKLDAALPVR